MLKRRRFYQFSLSGLLFLVVVSAILLGHWPKIRARYALSNLTNEDVQIGPSFIGTDIDFDEANGHAAVRRGLGKQARPYLVAAIDDATCSA